MLQRRAYLTMSEKRFRIISVAVIVFQLCVLGLSQLSNPLPANAAPPAWMDTTKTPQTRASLLLAAMTFDDKVNLVTGNYAALAHLNVPDMRAVDASSGLRGETGVTAFPVPEALAASFNSSLANSYGTTIGKEARAKRYNLLLGPTLDIARTGLSGRQTEGFSEDPYLTALIGGQVAAGLNSQRTIATLKHFAPYTQETDRFTQNITVSERALREIYTLPVQNILKQGKADAVMCSYPKINGTFACENPALLGLLRSQMGFKGFVMSDYEAGVDRVAAFNAGVDTTTLFAWFPREVFSSSAISPTRLDAAANNILYAMFNSGLFDNPLPVTAQTTVTTAQSQALAKTVGVESTVLLKNLNQILPLSKTAAQKIALIGPAGSDVITGPSGSSYVDPGSLVTPLQAITAAAGNNTITYSQGSLGDIPLPTIPASALTIPNGSAAGLLATFYGNTNFSGMPVATQVTPEVNFYGSPVSGLPAQWSARWTGKLKPTATGLVRFSALGAGTVKVTIGGQTILSGYRFSPNFMFGPVNFPVQGVAQLTAGTPVDITVEYSTQGAGFMGTSLNLGWQPQSLIPAAVAAAQQANVAIVFVNQASGEGMDRDSFNLPGDQNQLIDAVSKANPRTIVVLNTPGAVLMPWLSQVSGVLQVWYQGAAAGSAPAVVVFGEAEPGGRLPVTFPVNATQGPAKYQQGSNLIDYSEGIFVGYRWFDKNFQDPLYRFGYGLSYTSFSFGPASLTNNANGTITIGMNLTNTGSRAGADVVQLYLSLPTAANAAPQELKGVNKVFLQPGQTQQITFTLDATALSMWDSTTHAWKVVAGQYKVSLKDGTNPANLQIVYFNK